MRAIEKELGYPFLNGGGEMGSLMRAFNWDLTPVGDPLEWPQSLKTIINVLLNSRFPMFLWWGGDLIQFYNDAYRPSLGNNGKHPTALGQKGEECWPEIWPIIKPLIDQVLAGGGSTWSEDQLIPIYRNGTIEDVYWTFSYSPVMDDSGKINGVLVVCNETTEKVLNLFALEESEEQLRFAINATELGTWDYNPSTNKFTGNERLKEWFGLSPLAEIELETAIAIIAEYDRDRVSGAIKRALEYSSGGFYDIEYTIIHPTTQEARIVRAKGRAWFDENKLAYRFNGTLQDVTSEVLARQKIERAERNTRLAIESADLGTYQVNLLTDEMITSERFNAIWGVDRSLPHAKWISMIHPDDRCIRDKAQEEALQTGKIFYEIRIVHHDESVHWIRVNGNILYDDGGKPQYLLGMIQDITQQKELERHKDGFISMVSHELKTPLTSIFGYSQMLVEMMDKPGNEMLYGMAMRVNDLVQRLNYIVQDLVDVSRIEGDKLKFREDHFDLSQLVTQILEEMQTANPGNQFVVDTIDVAEIFADRERTSQVITNIIANAIKYSPAKAGIYISTYRENDMIICAIKDSGIGIPKESQAKIFERFYQAPTENKVNSGLGLGLYISSEIIKRQKGRIWIDSEPGKGTTIYFSLPGRNRMM